MKKVIRTAAMVALMFTTATGMAKDDKLSLETIKESKTLVFEADSDKQTAIKLIDDADHVIYFENVSDKSYAKKFDLTNLADGYYYFTSENALKKTTYTIAVKGDTVKILDKKDNAKPVFRTKDRMVYLNLLNLSKKDVNIKVYDSSNRLVFREKRENQAIIEKAFNFKDAYADRYTVVVSDANNTYYEDVVVK